MQVSVDLCFGCGRCLAFCPTGAISLANGKANIDRNRCVECSLCFRSAGCPAGALRPEEDLPWPRSLRRVFSDPMTEFKTTGNVGRGTEEMKTNDVTDRFQPGEVGFAVDVGRPNFGTTFKDIEKICQTLATVGVTFEPGNPITQFMTDPRGGNLLPELLPEFILSAVIECKVPCEKMAAVLAALRAAAFQVDTVFTVGVITRVDADGTIPVLEELQALGWPVRPNGKTNLGLGRK